MKTPSVLILFAIFLVCGNAVPLTEIVKKTKDPLIVIEEDSKNSENIIIIEDENVTKKVKNITAEDLDLLTFVQLITSNTCYFVTDATWPDALEDFVSVDLRVKLGDWCGRFSEFIVSSEVIG